jgi:hypothetical protein
MNNNTQRKSPMFAEVNVERQTKELPIHQERPRKRFAYIKLAYPSGVTLTLPSDTDPETLAGYLRIKV